LRMSEIYILICIPGSPILSINNQIFYTIFCLRKNNRNHITPEMRGRFSKTVLTKCFLPEKAVILFLKIR